MARILDLTSEVGAYGTRLLAEQGHEVVRVEPPGGDAVRRLHPHLRSHPDLESSAFHQFLNAGKRSFAVDLGSDEGRRLFLALAATADAVVASLPLPVDEADLHAANPRLVLVCIDDGPPELVAYARSGLLAITGEPDASPTLLGGHVPHAAVGLYVAMAAAAALFAGAGQVVDVDATQCLAALAEQVWVEYSMSGELLERMGSTGGITALAGALPCADGHWMVSVPPDPKGWTNFVQLVPDPAFKDDGSLADEALRRERKREILDRIAVWSQHRKKREIVDEAQRLHIPAATVANPLELVDDPQLLARGFLQPVDHPALGPINFPVGALASLAGHGIAFAPRLGQDTASLLSALGHPAGEIDRLAGACVIKTLSASPGDLA
jgi:CoA:oxalate CoA-transferase